jgi:CHAT domain-containing protein/Tfp pilus assembly protein PilF
VEAAQRVFGPSLTVEKKSQRRDVRPFQAGGMAMRVSYFIAAVIAGFLLMVSHPSSADSLDEATALDQQVAQLTKEGRYSDAVALETRALEIREKALGPDRPEVAESLYSVAWLYLKLERYADAEPLLKRSLAIKEKAHGYDDPRVAWLLNILAASYQEQHRYADAEPLYKRALAIRERALGPDHPDVAFSLFSLGSLYLQQGRIADAEPLSKRSLVIYEKTYGLDHPILASVLSNLAEGYEKQARYIDAAPFKARALEIEEKALGPDHPNVALSLYSLGTLYSTLGRYADAEPLFKRSLAINEKVYGGDSAIVAMVANNLAHLYDNQARYADAEPLYQRSLAILEKTNGPDDHTVGALLNNLGDLYRQQGRYADAEPLLKRSLAIDERAHGSNSPEFATSLNSLAGFYRAQARYADAEPLCKRALAIREKALGYDHPDVAVSLNNVAEIYRAEERYVDAELLFKRSLAISEKAFGPNHPSVATTLSNLALVYSALGRYAEAEALFQRAVGINEKSAGLDQHALSLNNLAFLYLTQRRYAEAESLFKRSLALWEKTLGSAHPSVATLLNSLTYLYKKQTRYTDALLLVQQLIEGSNANKPLALEVLHRSQLQALITPTQALDLSYKVFQQSASSAAGKAISALGARFAARSGELSELVRKDQDLAREADLLEKSMIAVLSNSSAAASAAEEDRLRKRSDKIETERSKLLHVFTRRFPGYVALSKPQPLSVKDTQALLANDEALVVFDLGLKSYAWIITQDQAQWQELGASAEDVAQEVATLRGSLDPASLKPFDTNVAHQLYKQVLKPFEDIISDKTRLSFVFTGALTSLPPQVLIASDPAGRDLTSVDWIVRKYAITVLPSTASLKILRGGKNVAAAAKPMIGFGDPVFDKTLQITTRPGLASLDRNLTSFYRGMIVDTGELAKALPALPETADELRAVGTELGAEREDIKLGEAATVTNIKHSPLDHYRVVYFATHALVAGDVEKFAKVKAEPALVLSIPDKPTDEDDGLLRASEVATLKMNADFVVLSACNTAAGDKPGAEALSGLARAFFYAGARSLIVSNWEVDSQSTVALMTGLFGALKNNPHLSHAEALRMSMLRMIDDSSKRDWAQPKYWAPFIVVGEPQKR